MSGLALALGTAGCTAEPSPESPLGYRAATGDPCDLDGIERFDVTERSPYRSEQADFTLLSCRARTGDSRGDGARRELGDLHISVTIYHKPGVRSPRGGVGDYRRQHRAGEF